MKTQNYHTQDGAIHYGYAHIASLALIDLIAEANKRLDSQVPPRGGEGNSGSVQNHQCAVLGGGKEGRQAKYSRENSSFGVFDRCCELSESGRTVDIYPVAARDLYFHENARITQQFSRSESGSHEPDHQST
jgi:hypothetical protein